MTEIIIRKIMVLSGPMPDPDAHRNYLRQLTLPALNARLFTLEQQSQKYISHEKIRIADFINSTKPIAEAG